MATNLPQRLKQLFAATALPAGVRLMVVRRDGLMVWDGSPDGNSQPLAALCGGMWEASLAMAQTAGAASDGTGFRLAFDDTAAGILVYPLTVAGETYYLGGVYRDCSNPGRLRHQVQSLRATVESHLSALPVEPKRAEVRTGYLFNDITDEEMDRLFGV